MIAWRSIEIDMIALATGWRDPATPAWCKGELRKLLRQSKLRVTVSRDALSAQFDLAGLAAWVAVL